jgi:hypothetical protein
MLCYQEVDAGIRLGANRRSYLENSLFDMDRWWIRRPSKGFTHEARELVSISKVPRNWVGCMAGKIAGVVTADLSTRWLRLVRYSVTGYTVSTKGQDHRQVEPLLFCVCPLQREAAIISSDRWSGQRTSPELQIRRA